MIQNRALSVTIFVLVLAQVHDPRAKGQDWAKPVLEQLQRLDLRDLGYPMVNEIPANSSAVTSLVTGRDGKIYGGTSGDDAFLFVFDPGTNKVLHL